MCKYIYIFIFCIFTNINQFTCIKKICTRNQDCTSLFNKFLVQKLIIPQDHVQTHRELDMTGGNSEGQNLSDEP